MENTYCLSLADLAYNIFYILTKNNSDINFVTFSQIKKYVEIIKKEAANNDIKIGFNLSRDNTSNFFYYHSKTFSRFGNDGIILNDGVTPYHLLWEKSSCPLDITILLTCESVEREILDMMNVKKSEKEVANIKFYLEELTRRINEFASKMEFEKCIELREKLRELQSIDKMLSKYDNENSINGEPKPKVLTKTRNEDKNETKQD